MTTSSFEPSACSTKETQARPPVAGPTQQHQSTATGSGTDVTIRRVEARFQQLEQWSQLFDVDPAYHVEPPPWELPPGFKLSVVIPVYNEETTLRAIVGRVAAVPIPKEIILVDDCSRDASREILKSFERISGVRVIYKPRNEGKGAALRTGFANASGDVVVVQDADLEYDPRDFPKLLEPIIRGEADVVYGSRFGGAKRQDPSWLHRLGNGVLTRASNLTTGLRLSDMETCYKAFRGDMLTELEIRQNRFGFEPEVTAKLARRGARIREVPISYDSRDYDAGKKIGLRDAINAFYCIVRYGFWP
ncbi:MAG: glycosyltransferase family 2 protein [Planctomycetota bacterium]